MRDYFCKLQHCNRARARSSYMVDKALEQKDLVIDHLQEHIALLNEEVDTLKIAVLPPDERIKALEEANDRLISALADMKDNQELLASNLWAYQDILLKK